MKFNLTLSVKTYINIVADVVSGGCMLIHVNNFRVCHVLFYCIYLESSSYDGFFNLSG